MYNSNVLHGRDELTTAIKSVVGDLKDGTASGLSILRRHDGSLTVSFDPYSTLKLLKRVGGMDATIRSLVVRACEKSESIGMGSSRLLIRILSNIVTLQAEQVGLPRIREVIRLIIDRLPSITGAPSQGSMIECLQEAVPDVSELVCNAVELAGSECKIFVEHSSTGVNVVERIDGHTFKVTPDPTFLKDGKWAASDVRCLVIDGIIERISEIDSLLHRCNHGKHSLAIFCRGFSDEVIGTLRVNHVRKTLNVIPITVAFDLESANVLSDIAIVIGCDVVSSLKGELVTTVKFDDIKLVRDMSCVGMSVTIIMSEMHEGLTAHLKNLIKKRNVEVIPTLKGILDMRIRSLSSASVIVRVSDYGMQGSKTLHDIDAGLKVVRNVIQHGVVTGKSIDGLEVPLPILKGVIDRICPTLALGSALHHALAVSESMHSGALFLSIDD